MQASLPAQGALTMICETLGHEEWRELGGKTPGQKHIPF